VKALKGGPARRLPSLTTPDFGREPTTSVTTPSKLLESLPSDQQSVNVIRGLPIYGMRGASEYRRRFYVTWDYRHVLGIAATLAPFAASSSPR